MMSYEDGWQDSPYGNAPTDAGYGYLGGLMAFDIAAIQDKYGVNEDTATGNDTYTLKDVNAAGTYYSSIWDAGGTDQIVYDGARDALIDLRAATLRYETGGGGRVSYAEGIYGGFTIANGVVIENARGGSGNDKLYGNAVANTLIGNAGKDLLQGGAGNDRLEGGAGDDWLDGGAGADTLIGGKGGSDVFFFGSDIGASRDSILDFGSGDLLVTTRKITDGDNDNVILFGRNKVLDLGNGASVAMKNEAGKTITTLYYNGSYSEDGVDYYLYSLSKTAGTAGFATKLADYDLA